MEVLKDHSIIRLEGECTVTSAAEMKRLLLEGLTSGQDLRVNLERVEKVDITTLQLLWAARQEIRGAGARLDFRLSEVVAGAARDAGLELLVESAVEVKDVESNTHC